MLGNGNNEQKLIHTAREWELVHAIGNRIDAASELGMIHAARKFEIDTY